MADSENRVAEGANAQLGEPRSAAPNRGAPASTPAEPWMPTATYQVVPSKRLEPETEFMTEHYRPVSLDDDDEEGGGGKIIQARLSDASIARKNKAEKSQTKKYAAIGIGLGLMVGLAAAFLLRHPSGAADMGAVNSAQYGLMGHLTTDWKNDRLSYQLTLEPVTLAQRSAFQTNLERSPRPITVILQAKDPFGAVLCSDAILVKFDPRFDPSVVTKDLPQNASKVAQAAAARAEITRGIDLARLEGQELQREHGKTLFQSVAGPDGVVASISAQGVLPCKKPDVDRFASWGFVSDFPIVAKAVASKDGGAGRGTNGDSSTASDDAQKSEEVAAVKAKKKPGPPPLPPIFVEGDDQIVYYDPSGGVAETRGGKALMLDKADTLVASMKGRDLPIEIHYRCYVTEGCTFSALGMGLHHARLRQ